MSSSQLGDHLCKNEVGPFQRELKLLQNQVHVHGQNEHKCENWKMLGRFLCKVCHHLQHRVYCLVNTVNILLQGKVQMVTPTYPMQVSTVVLYHS